MLFNEGGGFDADAFESDSPSITRFTVARPDLACALAGSSFKACSNASTALTEIFCKYEAKYETKFVAYSVRLYHEVQSLCVPILWPNQA